MSTAVMTTGFELNGTATKALKAAAGFWFAVAIVGQLVFAASLAIFYGHSAAHSNWQAWNSNMTKGYVPGHTLSNSAAAAHISGAVLIIILGALQLIPQVRQRFPVFHRWNGRVYLFGALAITGSAMYMIWIRGSVGDLTQHLGSTGNAVLVWICGGLALRRAMARDFTAHRRWALRLFIVLLGNWFYRVMFTLWMIAMGGPVGFDATTFTGPFLNFMAFGAYLLPLAILELYLLAQKSPLAGRRMTMAAALFVITLLMGAGAGAAAFGDWIPRMDLRNNKMTDLLAATIRAQGVDAAAAQYRSLRAQGFPNMYENETQTNGLGYQFLHSGQFPAAIAILRLNTETHPKSANTYDSLGEACMDAGDKTCAIESYRHAVALDPKMTSSVNALKRLTTP
ncbi:MAG TPA: DUF2306 domain-containing protein [Candidatus Acidoferrales bacterium]